MPEDKDNGTSGIEIDATELASSTDSGSQSSGGGSSGSSGTGGTGKNGAGFVTVSRRYGTTTFGPDTVCWECSRVADGVVVIDTSASDSMLGDKTCYPACSEHRASFEEAARRVGSESEYRRF